MERKEDTPVRKTRRKYEEKNKEKRKQASGNFGTMIPRALYDEINTFLEENGITKVRLIKEGYEALKNMQKNRKRCKRKRRTIPTIQTSAKNLQEQIRRNIDV